MFSQYGPWATPIGAGGNPQLSAFWRQRMTKLVPASQTSPTLSRRTVLCLGAAGLLTGVLPTLHAATAQADTETSPPGKYKPSAGRIYLIAHLKTKPIGANPKEDALGDVRGIIAVDPETGRWEKIIDGDNVGNVRAFRDGKALVFAKHGQASGRTETTEIWTYDLTTRRASRMAIDAASGIVCWSPDGKQILNVKWRLTDDRSHNVASLINLDGSGIKKLPIPETDEVDDWSSDGRWLVTVANREPPFGRGYQLYRMHLDGSSELRLTKNGLNCYPRFSPDSKRIVYLHQTGKEGNSLHTVDVDGNNDRTILREEALKSVEAGCFSPDGRRLAILRFDWKLDKKGAKYEEDPRDAHWRLEIADVDGGNRRELPLVGATAIWLGKPDWR
jgi:hypothetical protein